MREDFENTHADKLLAPKTPRELQNLAFVNTKKGKYDSLLVLFHKYL